VEFSRFNDVYVQPKVLFSKVHNPAGIRLLASYGRNYAGKSDLVSHLFRKKFIKAVGGKILRNTRENDILKI
jgi:hypothetical protein